MFDGDKKRDVREKIQTIRTTICNLCTTMYIRNYKLVVLQTVYSNISLQLRKIVS